MSDFFLILIAVFILFSVFRRYIFYAVMGALTKKMFDQATRQQQRYYQPGADKSPQGSVKVEDHKTRKNPGRSGGEYVDFEEIKD